MVLVEIAFYNRGLPSTRNGWNNLVYEFLFSSRSTAENWQDIDTLLPFLPPPLLFFLFFFFLFVWWPNLLRGDILMDSSAKKPQKFATMQGTTFLQQPLLDPLLTNMHLRCSGSWSIILIYFQALICLQVRVVWNVFPVEFPLHFFFFL